MDPTVNKNEHPFYQQLVLLLGLLALSAFCFELLRFFERPADNVRPDIWARAPYSDALAPWLVGSLYYVFDLPQIQYLYRPTVGLFWGSIIAATEKIWLVPQVLGTAFVVLLAGLVLIARQNWGLSLGLFLLLFAASAQLTFPPLLINTLYIDFAALIFTVTGTWLLIVSANGGSVGPITASILLGIAAAIRGPMMLGGPVLIVLLLGWSAGRTRRLWLACLSAFAIVVGADVVLQRVHQTANNGVESLYCVATDETRSWSPDCSARYNRLHPKPREVINMYLSSITTVDGLNSLTGGVERRFANDLMVFENSFVRAIIVVWSIFVASLCFLLNFNQRINRTIGIGVSSTSSQHHIADWMPSLAVVMLIGATAALNALGVRDVVVAMTLIFGLVLIALASRQRVALSLIASYVGCVIFLALLGYAAAHPRFAGTFSFLLLAAVSLLLIPRPVLQLQPLTQVGEVRLLAVCVLLAISFLYLGSRLWPSELRDTFARSVRGQQAALKLSYEPIADRALYITGSGGVVYTLGDTVPIGNVRRYSHVKYADRYGNLSFMQPNEFVD